MYYFTKEEMRDIASIAKDQLHNKPGQININHEGCAAGTDTKRRLYIKITNTPSKLLAFCHHCNRRGVKPLSCLPRVPITDSATVEWNSKADPSSVVLTDWGKTASEYHNAVPMADAMSIRLMAKFPLRFFNAEQIEGLRDRDYYGMRISGTTHVLIPRMGESGLLGVDKRSLEAGNLFDHTDMPKWKRTLALAEDMQEVAGRLIIYNTTQSRCGVVVEDPISAMRIDLLGYGAIALTGSSLDVDDAFKLSLLFDRLVVWLDNDSNTIIHNATAAAMRLSMFTKYKVPVIAKLSDPKSYDDQILLDTLQRNFQ